MIVLPGPPRELQPMEQGHQTAPVQDLPADDLPTGDHPDLGLPESSLADTLRDALSAIGF